MTQADLARQLRISTAYLSQMETNQRPVSASVLYGLSQLFGADAANLMSEDPDRLAADLREALSDPIFSQAETSDVDIRALALSAPWLAHRFIELHGAFRRTLDPSAVPEMPGTGRTEEPSRGVNAHPFEVVRDFFHYTDNYIDDLDQAAERLRRRLSTSVAAKSASSCSSCNPATASVCATCRRMMPAALVRSQKPRAQPECGDRCHNACLSSSPTRSRGWSAAR